MKKLISTLTACLILLTASFAQSGTHLQLSVINSKNMNGTIDLYVSKAGQRMDFTIASDSLRPGASGRKITSIITAKAPDQVIRLNDRQQTYSEMALDKMKVPDTQKYTVQLIGTDTILGLACKHLMMTGNSTTHEIWTTTGIDMKKFEDILSIDPRWISAIRRQALMDAAAYGFPVKDIQTNPKTGTTTLELIRNEKQDLPAAYFEVPEGFKKVERLPSQQGTGAGKSQGPTDTGK